MNKFSNYIFFALFIFLAAFVMAGCGTPDYKDGTYTGKSDPDDEGAYGEVTLTISGGKIDACRFVTWQKEGIVKGEDYGKINGEISNQSYYDMAQLAVRAMEQYARDLSRTGNLKDVQAVSGATIAYDQFREAVEIALETAARQ
jgi:major membrane immunogen (membrane-anchored lipoprotein)